MRTVKLLLALLSTLLGAVVPASAATFVVTKTEDDNGPCTPDDCALREALLASQEVDPEFREPHVIEIPAGVYRLTLPGPGDDSGRYGALALTSTLVALRGDPEGEVVIQGDGSDSVLVSLVAYLEIENITFEGGRADHGGGLEIIAGILRMSNSVVRSNHALVAGGGLWMVETHAEIRDSLISGNTSDDSAGGVYGYSSVTPVHGSISIFNTTITGNSAPTGGGIVVEGEMGLGLHQVTLAGNSASVGSAMTSQRRPFLEGSLIEGECVSSIVAYSNGGNVESPGATCFEAGADDRPSLDDLGLLPLADNGGPTPTRALVRGSPAIDVAPLVTCQPTDQRGYARPVDGDGVGLNQCDAGAFEFGAGPVVVEVPTLSSTSLLALAMTLAWIALSRFRDGRI